MKSPFLLPFSLKNGRISKLLCLFAQLTIAVVSLLVQKKAKEKISDIPKEFTLVVEDESILIHDKRRFFRQYSTFTPDTCLQYLKELQRKLRRLMLFLDKSSTTLSKVKVLLELNIYRKDHLCSVLLNNTGGKESMKFFYQVVSKLCLCRAASLIQPAGRFNNMKYDIYKILWTIS